MRKDIKKRLEKALITLEEPGGSTIQKIVEVINKESPVLSVRKVLEALQEGINEGFLCMYNGRFKLRQQVHRDGETRHSRKDGSGERRNAGKTKTPVSNYQEDDSDFLSDDDDEDEDEDVFNDEPNTTTTTRRIMCKRLPEFSSMKKEQKHTSKKSVGRRKRSRRMSKKESIKRKQQEAKRAMKHAKDFTKLEESILEMTSNEREKSSRPPAGERPDLKKQRGPRCTSMKKDVRMPSKVHIPFMPTSVPPRSNNFNDLVRRSPVPVNGPLFDSIAITTAEPSFFGTYF